MAGPIEAKAAAGTTTTLVAGYLSALAIEIIPWLKDNLTPDQQKNLPIIIAFVFTAVATYYAPHTHRPDLVPAPAVAPRHAAPEEITATQPPVQP